jgi:hypothetical protein
VKFPETIVKKTIPEAKVSPVPAVRKSKAVVTKDSVKTKAVVTKDPGKAKPVLSDKAKEKLIIQAKRAEENELIEAIKEVYDREGTGLVDGQQLRLLLGSLGNKLGKHEMGVVTQFEDKAGMVQYEKLIKTIIFE